MPRKSSSTPTDASGFASVQGQPYLVEASPGIEREDVATRVAAFLQAGAEAGGHCLVLAMPEHTRLLQERLGSVPVTWRDAADVLATFVVSGWPDEAAFDRSVGRMLRTSTSQGPVYVYAELTALLCMQGQNRAAVRVEHLWNALGATLPRGMFHHYHARVFASEADHVRYREASGRTAETFPESRRQE